MVRLRPFGGGLSSQRLAEAARLRSLGNIAGAVAIYRELLDQPPYNLDALLMMGVIAQQSGDTELALSLTNSALEIDSCYSPAWYNRSVFLRMLRRTGEALLAVERAVALAPSLSQGWDIHGQILREMGKPSDALRSHARALEIEPANPDFIANLSFALLECGDLTGAYAAIQKALALGGAPASAYLLQGNILKAMGHLHEAEISFDRAAQGSGMERSASTNRAITLLQMGNYKDGFAAWEQREEFETSLSIFPLWNGRKVDTLVLYEDQGIGDAVQFLRFIPSLKDYVRKLKLVVRAPLVSLCKENFPSIDVFCEQEIDALLASNSSETFRCRLSSLPFFLRVDLETIPQTPYLKAPATKHIQVPSSLEARQRPLIGLVWSGNHEFRRDAERSFDPSTYLPLVDLSPHHFVSLQKPSAIMPQTATPASIDDLAAGFEDFLDTATAITRLDLVISVDTATAHVAGALGIPVFILLPFECDWRWLLGREDSPWYLSARLFRQKSPGNWDEVIERVRVDLQKLFAGDRSILQAKKWNGENLRIHPNALALPSV